MSNTPDLSLADLERVTKLTQGAAQCRFFEKQGLHPMRRPDGHPIVTWSALDAYQLGSVNRGLGVSSNAREYSPDEIA